MYTNAEIAPLLALSPYSHTVIMKASRVVFSYSLFALDIFFLSSLNWNLHEHKSYNDVLFIAALSAL